jgi:hypothetical protein
MKYSLNDIKGKVCVITGGGGVLGKPGGLCGWRLWSAHGC